MKPQHINKWFVIQEGQEQTYKALGFDVFEKRKPKKNADSLQEPSANDNGNG